MKQVKFQLKNKLKVILIPSHKSPVVSVQMWVKTGSADEKKGEEGISHFIEHLVFKGTDKYKVGEIASVVEASGGELNAYTSFDQTVFYVTISKTFKDVALSVVSQMMGHPTFDAAEVDSEREVVCEEIKMGLDSPGRQSSQLLFGTVFSKHAYGKPVIGYEKNVRGWSVKKIKQYFQSRYVPSNMCLIVSGDFEAKEMKSLVEKYFADFKNYKLKKMKRPQEPKSKKIIFKAQTKDLKESAFNIAFRAPNIKHKDVPALDVLMMILGQGDTSRLFSKMRLENNLVNNVSAYNYNPQDPGLISLSFKTLDQDPLEAFKVLFAEVEKVKKQEVSWSEIKKAITILSSEQFYSIETTDGIANKIGSAEFYMGDSSAHEKYLKIIQKITPASLKKMANKYFDEKCVFYSALTPRAEKETEKTLKQGHEIWKNLISNSVKAKPEKNTKIKIPKIEFKKLKSKDAVKTEVHTTQKGIKIIFQNSSEIPTVSAKILFGAGARIESPESLGLTELITRTWTSGTRKKTEAQLLQSIEELAAGISPFGGKNTIGLTVDYMKAFEKEVLALTEEIVLDSIFPESIIAREKDGMLRQIKAKDDQPSYLCGKQFVQNLFPNHPISYDTLGTEETLKNINKEKINEYFKKIFHAQNVTIVVVGDYDKKAWIKLAEGLEKSFSNGARLQEHVPVSALTENKKFFLEKDKEQSHVIVGWRGLSINDNDRYVLQIIQAILAGQGGRLFIELRDKNSLAYSVAPIHLEALESGYFGGYIACSPDKVEKSLEMFHAEFKKISTVKVSEPELLRAKRYLIGQHDIGLQRKSAICNTIIFDDFYGNNFMESLNVAEQYNKITTDDVLRVSKKLFSENYITSIVGKK